MFQKGYVPPIVLILLAVIGISAVVIIKNLPINQPQPSTTNQQEEANSSSVSEESGSTITPTKSKSQTPSPTSAPKTGSTNSTPTPTPTSSVQKNSCVINVIYGRLGAADSDPLLVTLVYSFNSHNNAYMTGAQWDFDGNGTWDTDLKQSNGTIEHTYSSGGNYTAKLKLQDSNGDMTDICSNSFSLSSAIDVSLNGQVFRDLNCNNSKDSGEGGISGVKFTIMSSSGMVYQNTTTDQNGNYSFSKRIAINSSLPLLISTADHSYYFDSKYVTLNQQNNSATLDIPYCQ